MCHGSDLSQSGHLYARTRLHMKQECTLRRRRRRRKKKKKNSSPYFQQLIPSPNMWHFNQTPWEIIGLCGRNEEFFHSGHMHGVHRNACLTYLFIASNSLVVWAGRHKDISKHKPRPAKSWVVRLISKRRQCSAEARDPILVITLPPPSPPRDSRRSLNISFSVLVSLLRLGAFRYSGRVLTGRSAKLWQRC